MADAQGFTADELAAVNRWLLAKGMELLERVNTLPTDTPDYQRAQIGGWWAAQWQSDVADQLSALHDAGGTEGDAPQANGEPAENGGDL